MNETCVAKFVNVEDAERKQNVLPLSIELWKKRPWCMQPLHNLVREPKHAREVDQYTR